MLKLDDIVALAKSGYKVDDIKELIKLSKESEESEKTTIQEEVPESEKAPIQEEVPAKSTIENDNKPSDDSEKIVDYKKRAEELEAKLSDLQKANTKQNIADTEKSDSEAFAEVMRSFM